MRAVLDTNVFISGVLSDLGAPAAILNAWRGGSFQLITSVPLLEELTDVLMRPSIRKRTSFSTAEETAFVGALADAAIVVEPTEVLTVIANDPQDDRLLEAAVAGRADYVVSGDDEVLKLATLRGAQCVTPARFLAILTAEVLDE